MGLIAELRSRNVLRMAALYVVAAWLIMQVAEVIVTLGALPAWTGRVLLVVLVVGFPIALVLSWFYELTPEGITAEKGGEAHGSITHLSGRRMDFIVISLLCAAVLVFAADKWWPRGPIDQSIAVLPFANLSDDPEQEFFSDGISEDILNLLTRVPELRVISRSSAFSFKGQNVDIPTIAANLNVAHVLEGSIRRAGNQVRITAKLIDVTSDTHLWSQTYDREIKSVFAIQDEIAAAVVEELKVRLVSPRPKAIETRPEAYTLYLQAQYLTTQGRYRESIELFSRVLALDPSYAPAWDGIANNYVFMSGFGIVPIDDGFRLASEAIDKALALDPELAHAHALRGRIARGYHYDLEAAARHYQRALELEPTHDDINRGTAVVLTSLGRVEEAMAFNEYAVVRDPVNPISHTNLGQGYIIAERWDDAIAACRTALRLQAAALGAHFCIGEALRFKGEAAEALNEFQQESLDSLRLVGSTMAYHALDRFSESDAAMAELIDQHGKSWAFQIAYAYDYRGEFDSVFEWLEKAVEFRDPGVSEMGGMHAWFRNASHDPRWLPFLTRIGLAPDQLAAIEFDVSVPPMRPDSG